ADPASSSPEALEFQAMSFQTPSSPDRHKRSSSFRSPGGPPPAAPSAAAADAPGSTAKRFSLTDALTKSQPTQPPLSPTSRQKRRTSAASTGESSAQVFEKRLEESLRDLRIMQARMNRNSAATAAGSCGTCSGGGIGGSGGSGGSSGGGGSRPPAAGQSSQHPAAAANPLPLSPQTPQTDRDGDSPIGPPVARQRAMSLAASALSGMELTGHRSLSSLVGRGGEAIAPVSMATNEEAASSSASKLAIGGCAGGGCIAVSGSCDYRRERRRASMQDAIDASKINADLYSKVYNQTSAIQSIQEENLGQLNFSLSYREDTGILTVRIIQAIDLQPKDSSTGSVNPYCRVALLPNRKTQSTTKVHKKTLRPEFEEAFIFELAQQDIHWSVLEITVFDYDPCSLDDCLGQVRLPLTDVLDADSAAAGAEVQTTLWKGLTSLEKDPDPEHKIGDLMFSLSFLSAASALACQS
ncbi:hypothetical protein BOX15_Mlig020454g2, partial [Macrostomum lignano]